MPSDFFALKNDFVAKSRISAAFLNRLVNIVASQVPGALEALGVGVLAVPDARALEVTGAGGALNVREGQAVVRHPRGNLVWARLQTPEQVLGVGAEAPFVHLQLAQAEEAGDPDSEEGDDAFVIASDQDELPGALLLAEWRSDGPLVDRRRWSRIEALERALEQVLADVGYTPAERAKGSVAARLNALAGGGSGGGEGAAVFWEYLARTESSSTTIEEFVTARDEALAATLRAEAAAGGQVPVVLDDDFYAHQQALHAIALRKIDTMIAEDFEGAYVVANVGGDGTADTQNHVGPGTMVKGDRGWTP